MHRIFRKKHANQRKKRLTVGALMLRGAAQTERSLFSKTLPTLSLLTIFLVTVLLQSLFPLMSQQLYELSATDKELTGASRDDTAEYLKLSEDGSGYHFEVPEAPGEAGQSVHTGRVSDAYSAYLSTNADKGITVTENITNIAVTLIPDFHTNPGQKVEGDHLVYPTGPDKLVYTLKYNGLKEDIIVPEYRKDELSYRFTLRLPSGVEARKDNQGNIGIYSSDPTLFGNISFGSEEDRKRVDKARENGEKSHLVMKIPYPIIKDSSGVEYADKATFELGDKKQTKNEEIRADLPADIPKSIVTNNEYSLTIKAKGLEDLTYPIAIDPTMQVNTDNTFEGVEAGFNVDIDTAGQEIKRSSLTGGAIDSWTSIAGENPHTQGRFVNAGVAYNGYLYEVGGNNAGNNGKTRFSKINSDGSLSQPTAGNNCSGVWCETIDLFNHQGTSVNVLAYNGYMYRIGHRTPNNTQNLNQYAKINSDGTLSNPVNSAIPNWEVTTANTYYNRNMPIAINGWMYIMGGCVFLCNTSGHSTTTVERAAINADGSLGTWTTSGTTSLPTGTRDARAVHYNNRIYLLGGMLATGGNSSTQTIWIELNADGTMGSTWKTATDLPVSLTGHGAEIVNGYVYIFGGYTSNSSAGNVHSGVYYAPIHTDGSLGVWQQSSSLNETKYSFASAYFNGWFYIIGGCGADSCNAYRNTVERTQIKPAGELHNGAFAEKTTDAPTARFYHATVVTHGKIYISGGCSNTTCSTILNTLQHASISQTGVIGSYATVTNSPALQRFGHASVVAGNAIYILGGCTAGGGNFCETATSDTYYHELNLAGGFVGSWQTATSPFAGKRFGHTAVTHKGHIYVGGGYSADQSSTYDCDPSAGGVQSYCRDIQRVLPDSDGNITSAWVADDSFSVARRFHRMHIYAGRLYVIGGYSGGADCNGNVGGTQLFCNDVQYATVNADGSIGAFTTDTGVSFSNGRYGHGAFFDKGYLYVVGGCGAESAPSGRCTDIRSDVQFAQVNEDGSIGTWRTTQSAPEGRLGSSVFSLYNTIFVVAGCSAAASGSLPTACTTTENSALTQVINNGGPGTFDLAVAATETGVPARFAHTNYVYNGHVYMVGGCSTSSPLVFSGVECDAGEATIDIQYTKLDDDGMFSTPSGGSACSGDWCRAVFLPNNESARFPIVEMYKGYIYIVNIKNFTLAPVHSAPILADGSIGSWTAQPSLPSTRRLAASVRAGNVWYVLGGADNFYNPLNTAVYTTLDSGSVSWTTTTAAQNFSEARMNAAASVFRNRLYIFGGSTDPIGNARLTTIESAQLDDTGMIIDNSWETMVDHPHIGLVANFGPNSAETYNGYFYLPTFTAGTLRIPILSSGKLDIGQLASAGFTVGVTQLRYSNRLIINGRHYIIGGYDLGGNVLSTQAFATTIHSIPRVGSFSRFYDFESGVRPTKLITRGAKQTGATVSVKQSSNVSCDNTAYDNSLITADIGFTGVNALDAHLGSGRTLARCFLVRYTIDDARSAGFPDQGNESTITNFDLYFTANPGSRLRGGRTFIHGQDRGLDPAPQ